MGWLRTAVHHADLDQNVLLRLLGIFDENVKETIFIEYSRIQQLLFHIASIASLYWYRSD